MTTTKTSLICNKFGGIKRIAANFSEEMISCSDCQNVELFDVGINSGVGIRTAKGNIRLSEKLDNENLLVYTYTNETLTQVATDGEVVNKELSFTISETEYEDFIRNSELDIKVSNIPYYAFSKTVSEVTTTYYTAKTGEDYISLFGANEKIINIFYSNQDSTKYCFIYTEDNTEGKIYSYVNKTLTELIDGLSLTGNACGVDFTQGWNDLFMFTNGVEVVKIDMDAVTVATELTLTGTEAESVTGLGFKVYNSRLWIFKNNRLWYSYKGDCTDFSTTQPTHTTSAGYIEFSKNITAIYPYLGSLAIFYSDSSCLLTADSEDNFTVSDDSPGGCCGYEALIFHGTDLFFYDDTKKGVFSFQQVVNGDKTLGPNIAHDLQKELLEVDKSKLDKIKALSVVLSDRNEVWFMLPSKDNKNTFILIYDCIHNEWVKRKEQVINCIRIVDNNIYSGGKDLYEEYNGYTFNGEWIQSYYYATPLNLGSNTTLKMLYFPPRLTIDTSSINDFWVRYIKNFDFFKREKKKHIVTKTLKNVLYWNQGNWNDGLYYVPKNCSAIVKFPTNTFKTLEMRLYTENSQQGFCIKSMEFSKIKVKTA